MTKTQNSSTQSEVARNNKNPPKERRYGKNREQSHFFLFYTYRDKFNMDRMEERGVEEIITNL